MYLNIIHHRNKIFSEVEIRAGGRFSHPLTAHLEKLEPGLYPLNRPCDHQPEGLALDFGSPKFLTLV